MQSAYGRGTGEGSQQDTGRDDGGDRGGNPFQDDVYEGVKPAPNPFTEVPTNPAVPTPQSPQAYGAGDEQLIDELTNLTIEENSAWSDLLNQQIDDQQQQDGQDQQSDYQQQQQEGDEQQQSSSVNQPQEDVLTAGYGDDVYEGTSRVTGESDAVDLSQFYTDDGFLNIAQIAQAMSADGNGSGNAISDQNNSLGTVGVNIETPLAWDNTSTADISNLWGGDNTSATNPSVPTDFSQYATPMDNMPDPSMLQGTNAQIVDLSSYGDQASSNYDSNTNYSYETNNNYDSSIQMDQIDTSTGWN